MIIITNISVNGMARIGGEYVETCWSEKHNFLREM
jgi:hypothetical protein